MGITFELVQGKLAVFFFVLTRISAVVLSMPVFGTRLLPGRIKLGLIFAMTFLVMVNKPMYLAIELLSLQTALIIFQQLLIGIVIGLTLQIVFQIFLLMGQIVSMQAGLGFATLNDPATNLSVPTVGQLFLMMITLLFLTMDGHLAVFQVLITSFDMLPISIFGIETEDFGSLSRLGSWLFSQALNLSLPAITALLMVNIFFGVLTKAAPQLNIFSIGFPITMVLGIIIIWANLVYIYPFFEKYLSESLMLLTSILEVSNNG